MGFLVICLIVYGIHILIKKINYARLIEIFETYTCHTFLNFAVMVLNVNQLLKMNLRNFNDIHKFSKINSK